MDKVEVGTEGVLFQTDPPETERRSDALLELAIRIALDAHAGQTDKAGSPYVTHPLRVMSRLKTNAERIVGVLHDVVEDCPGWTFERLSDLGFGPDILGPLSLVTKNPDDDLSNVEAYMAFIDRCALDPVAARVKLADLDDNMDLGRIPAPTQRDFARVRKYALARQRLSRALRDHGSTRSKDREQTDRIIAVLKYRFSSKVRIEARASGGRLFEKQTGLPVELVNDSIYELRGVGDDFPSLPACYRSGKTLSATIVTKGTLMFAEICNKKLSKELALWTWAGPGQPARRYRHNPNDPLNPTLRLSHDKVLYVEMNPLEDLKLLVTAGRDATLAGCKVKVPSLDETYQSLNQAYSAIARSFEPWRRSVAGNVFEKVYIVDPFWNESQGGQPGLVWLDYLRGREELDALAILVSDQEELSR